MKIALFSMDIIITKLPQTEFKSRIMGDGMRNYSIYIIKNKTEFTNLYQYLSEKIINNLSNRYCHSYHPHLHMECCH